MTYFTEEQKNLVRKVIEAKEIAYKCNAYVSNSEKRSSQYYVFTYLPKHDASENALKQIKKIIKGTGLRVKLQGRAGINGTQYRGCFNRSSFVSLKQATRADVYIYERS